MFEAFGMDRPPRARRTRRTVRPRAVRGDVGLRGRPEAPDRVPTECHGGRRIDPTRTDPFFSLCEHHAFPLYGVAHVGYVAHEQIIGISKMTRLVRVYARRFTVNALGQQIADHLNDMMEPHGVAVHLEAAPVHPDARRPRRAVEDDHVVLARELRTRFGDAARVPDGRPARG